MTDHNIQAVFANVRGNSFVGLDTEVVVPLKGGKGNPMKGRVTKRTRGSRVQVFQNKNGSAYGAMVHRRLAQQLQRQAGLRAAEKSEAMTKAIMENTVTEEQLADLAGSVESYMDEAKHKGEARDLFTLSPRKWGERIEGTPFIQHTKDGHLKHYLEVIFLKAGTSEFFLDGNPINKEDIVGLDEAEKKVSPEVQGGLEASVQVVVRTFEVSSLTGIRLDSTDYQGDFYYA